MTGMTIIEEAVRLVKEGRPVTLKAKGRSMLPFIKGEEDSIILVQADHPRVGDIVLACVGDNRYVIHRIITIEGQQITLMGDGNLSEQEHCLIKDIAARVDYIVKPDGSQRYLYTNCRRWLGRLWFRLLPLRRYLLAIYKRL